jgi:hypothetical protein
MANRPVLTQGANRSIHDLKAVLGNLRAGDFRGVSPVVSAVSQDEADARLADRISRFVLRRGR